MALGVQSMKKELTEKKVEQIFHENHEDYELIKDGGWISEGKYDYCDRIFKDADGTHWSVGANRSGSYFSNYEHSYSDEIIEVEEKEVMVKEWIAVED